MEAIDVGILSILPPIIAIALALITKEVISSLLVGQDAKDGITADNSVSVSNGKHDLSK